MNQSELTNYEQFQLEKYDNILPAVMVAPDGSCENNEAEINRNAEWCQMQAERQLQESSY